MLDFDKTLNYRYQQDGLFEQLARVQRARGIPDEYVIDPKKYWIGCTLNKMTNEPTALALFNGEDVR